METTNVTLRMDKDIKESADKLFAALGLSFSSAVNIFVRKALRTQSIPFEISMDSSTATENARLTLLESILTSPEAQKRFLEIGQGSPHTYDAISGKEEAVKLIESLNK